MEHQISVSSWLMHFSKSLRPWAPCRAITGYYCLVCPMRTGARCVINCLPYRHPGDTGGRIPQLCTPLCVECRLFCFTPASVYSFTPHACPAGTLKFCNILGRLFSDDHQFIYYFCCLSNCEPLTIVKQTSLALAC